MGQLPLKYGRTCFVGPSTPATFISIYELFGPTYPGKFDSQMESYFLQYDDGACLAFPIPKEYQQLYSNGDNLPIEFPNGSTPAVSRLLIYSGKNFMTPQTISRPNSLYFEKVHVEFGLEISISFSIQKKIIQFGMSPQEVFCEIGEPSSIFYKPNLDSDKQVRTIEGRDYFHNYFHLGLDILYDCVMHTAKKITLRTNFPGTPEFNSYFKCNYQLDIQNSTNTSGDPKMTKINPDMKWSEIQEQLGLSKLRPVVHDAGSAAHPFGSTLSYTPFCGCSFEVMRNDYIASVTLGEEYNAPDSLTA